MQWVYNTYIISSSFTVWNDCGFVQKTPVREELSGRMTILLRGERRNVLTAAER